MTSYERVRTSISVSLLQRHQKRMHSILYIFAVNITEDESITSEQRYESTWHEEMKNNDQCESVTQSEQLVFFAVVCSSSMIFSESAVNQNASINKNSKSSNSRSLRQHTLAKSISLCCFDFHFVLRNRSFHHTNLQISLASIEIKILNKILILAAFAYIFYLRLLLRIFCFRIYLFTSIASALNSLASIMICHAIYASVNESLCNVNR